jgi:hypothetical protein
MCSSFAIGIHAIRTRAAVSTVAGPDSILPEPRLGNSIESQVPRGRRSAVVGEDTHRAAGLARPKGRVSASTAATLRIQHAIPIPAQDGGWRCATPRVSP